MKYLKIRLSLICFFIIHYLSAQVFMENGEWRTHFSYNSTDFVEVTPSTVYALSGGNLYSLSKSEEEIITYSKVTGLSDNGIAKIKYIPSKSLLMIAYENGNIDFLGQTDGEVANIKDILNKNIVAEKRVNQALWFENSLFLSMPFGIVKVNVDKVEVSDTYYMLDSLNQYMSILSLSVIGEQFFAVSEKDVFTAPTNGVNLANFQNWSRLGNTPAGDNMYAVSSGDKLYLLKKDSTLHIFQNSTWYPNVDKGVTSIALYDGKVSFTKENSVVVDDKNIQMPIKPQMAIADSKFGCVWVACYEYGVYAISLNDNLSSKAYKPLGPAVSEMWRMRWAGGRMFAVAGGRWAVPFDIKGRVMIFDGFHWKEITQEEFSAAVPYPAAHDFVDIAIDPNDNSHFWVGTSGSGILECRDDKPIFDFDWADGKDIYNQVENAVFDHNGSLWIANPKANYYIKRIDYQNGSYSVVPILNTNPSGIYATAEFLIDYKDSRYKYLVMARGNTKVVVLDDNNTPETSDDNSRIFSDFIDQDGKVFVAENFLCAEQDRQTGALWIGTNAGPIVLPNPKRVFDSDYRCQRIKISRNDGTSYADYLLESEVINSIAIDGNNRKWIGTESSGVYLLNEDGTEEIYHFTQDNSPLLSNFIRNISINHHTGEVFFATNKGLISFQGEATEASDSYAGAHAFPNPVRPDYSGDITIKGLVENSIVKILDTRGGLVYETKVLGGSAVWSGRLSSGKRVASGVYNAVCITADKSQSTVIKILIVK